MQMERAVLVTFLLTSVVVGNAYYQKKQFYPSVVHITKSNASMMVIYLQALIVVVLLGKLVKRIFFGQLRAAEVEHLIDRSWYAITETCLAFTVFREDFSVKFVALFTVLLFLKAFHWLVEDRVDFMERSPVISWLFHVRVTSLLLMLGALDWHFVQVAYHATVNQGASVQLVFGFEYAILLTMVATVFYKYVLHTYDLNRETPWEEKAVFFLYAELLFGLVKVIIYMLFMLIMIRVYTLPLFAVRPMYLAMRSFKKSLTDIVLSRRAIRNLNTLYPDATADDLANSDSVCIICREEMTTGAKKLPCNHIFHAACLRSWFQRQQTCPTCRLEVLRPTLLTVTPPRAGAVPPQAAAAPQPAAPQPAAAAPHPAAAAPPPVHQAPPAAPFIPPPFTFPFPMVPPQAVPPPPPGAAATPTLPDIPLPFTLPPFVPFVVPPPRPPLNLGAFTEAELQEMEGQERRHLEARIRVLRDIQTLLDAAVLQMNQYGALVACLSSEPPTAAGATNQTREPSSEPGSEPSFNPSVPSPPAAPAPASHVQAAPEEPSPPAPSQAERVAVEETNLSDQERLRRRRLQRFVNGGGIDD